MKGNGQKKQMIETEKILQTKISSRITRKEIKPNKRIDKILSEICLAFNIEKPKVLFCDTLTRRISSFEFRGTWYIVFDNSLFEFLFLYDKLIISDTDTADVDKLYYKILYEECLFQEYPLALPCYQMYKSKTFSFEDQFDNETNVHMAYQLHFLLLHEIAHIKFSQNNNRQDFLDFKEVMFRSLFIAVKEELTQRSPGGVSSIKKGLLNFFGVNADIAGSSDATWDDLPYMLEMGKMDALLEECYCDFQAFKYIFETYHDPKTEISASYSLLHFLISSEFIRNSFSKHTITMNKDIDIPSFTSILRIMMFSLIVSFNECDIEKTLLVKCTKIFSRYSEILDIVNSLPKTATDAKLKASLIKMSREYKFEEG